MPGTSPATLGMHNRPAAQSSLPFFLLVFVLSAPFWALGAVIDCQLMPGLPIAALTFVCPAVAALILAYRQSRNAGFRALLKRSFDGARIAMLWFLPIVLLMPGVTAVSFLALRWSGVAVPAPQIAVLPTIGLFLVFMVGALGEELGWTGFALDRLQTRWSVLESGLLLGGVWAVWHWVPLIQAHRSPAWIAWWTLGTVSERLIMVWLYNRTGRSVFGVVVFHAVSNVCWQLFPVQGSFFDPRVNAVILAVVATGVMLSGSQRKASHAA